eukprot:8692495-Heterocapsa_arctica.AAC.1
MESPPWRNRASGTSGTSSGHGVRTGTANAHTQWNSRWYPRSSRTTWCRSPSWAPSPSFRTPHE